MFDSKGFLKALFSLMRLMRDPSDSGGANSRRNEKWKQINSREDTHMPQQLPTSSWCLDAAAAS